MALSSSAFFGRCVDGQRYVCLHSVALVVVGFVAGEAHAPASGATVGGVVVAVGGAQADRVGAPAAAAEDSAVVGGVVAGFAFVGGGGGVWVVCAAGPFPDVAGYVV